jgi:ABC-type antimicrobial peptide transport system permease subunit
VPLADSARHDIRNERDAMLVLQVLSALALVLAATGLFAVMAYAVAQRQREFGVRIALGATPENLQWFVLGRGLRLTMLGIALGLGAAWGLTRFLRTILYETSPHDPITYAGVAVVLLGVAALACWLPARKASMVNPIEALRTE